MQPLYSCKLDNSALTCNYGGESTQISDSWLSEKPRKFAPLWLELHGSLEMGKEVGNIQPMRDLSLMITLYHLLPGEGNGNPLQYSCLENSMDRGSRWATIRGTVKSQT